MVGRAARPQAWQRDRAQSYRASDGDLPGHCTIVSAIDGHPATLAWLGAVAGHKTVPLGIEHFGQTGQIADLYAHYGIDAESIAMLSAACRTAGGCTG